MKHKTLAILCAAVLSAGMLTGCRTKEAAEETKTQETAEKSDEKAATVSDEEEDSFLFDEKSDEKAATVSDEEAEKAGFSDGEEASSQEESSSDKEDRETVLDTSSELTGIHHARISVKDYGEIQVELDADTAPITVTNFVKLAQDGFYDGLTFHRIMDGFMVQGGDPLGNGTGGSDEEIKGEFSNNGVENDISHTRGVISMARAMDPDSASSQFFIVHEDSTFLDGDYAGFGHVTEGMDVVDKICEDAQPIDDNGTIVPEEQPVIESITIVD